MNKPELPSEAVLITANSQQLKNLAVQACSDNSQNILDSDIPQNSVDYPTRCTKLSLKNELSRIQKLTEMINKIDPLEVIKTLSHDDISTKMELLENFTTDIAPSDLLGRTVIENCQKVKSDEKFQTESESDQIRESHLICLQDIINDRNEDMARAMKLKGFKIDLAERWAKAEFSQAKEMAEFEKQKLAWNYESEIITKVLKSRHLLGNVENDGFCSGEDEDIEDFRIEGLDKKQLSGDRKTSSERKISTEKPRSRKTSESNSSHKSKNVYKKSPPKRQKPALLEEYEPYAIFELTEDDIESDWKFLSEKCLKHTRTEQMFEHKTEEEFIEQNLTKMEVEMKIHGVDKLTSVDCSLKSKNGRNSSYCDFSGGFGNYGSHVIMNSNSNSSQSNHQWAVDGLLIGNDGAGVAGEGSDNLNSLVFDKKMVMMNGRVFFEGSNIKLRISSQIGPPAHMREFQKCCIFQRHTYSYFHSAFNKPIIRSINFLFKTCAFILSSTIDGNIVEIRSDQFTIEYEGKRQIFNKSLLTKYTLVM